MADLASSVSTVTDIFGTIIYFVIILAGVISAGFVLWRSGILQPRPYNCLVFVPRASGGVDLRFPKGRRLEHGKFEIFYGHNNKVETETPLEEFVYSPNWYVFYRPDEDTHVPCGLEINHDKLIVEPAMSPAARLAVAKKTKDDAMRYNKQSLLEKYGVYASIFIAALILGLTFIVGVGAVAGPMEQAAKAASASASTNQQLTDALLDYIGEDRADSGPQPPYPPG